MITMGGIDSIGGDDGVDPIEPTVPPQPAPDATQRREKQSDPPKKKKKKTDLERDAAPPAGPTYGPDGKIIVPPQEPGQQIDEDA